MKNYMKNFCGGEMVTESTYPNLQKDNFTGRHNGQIDFNVERIRVEIEKYNSERGVVEK